PGSPDHAYYLQVRTRLGGKRAALSVARKLAREAYHTLRTLGDQALGAVALRPAACPADHQVRHGSIDQLMWCGPLPDAPAATRSSWTAPIERAAAPAPREADHPSCRRTMVRAPG